MQELPKSTAFGLLNTLREYEMVSQGRDGRYSLGIRLFEYGCPGEPGVGTCRGWRGRISSSSRRR